MNWLIGFCCLTLACLAQAAQIIHYMPAEDSDDKRLAYILDLLSLALQKDGLAKQDIIFKPLPTSVSYARAIHQMKRDAYENYFTPGGANIEVLGTENLISVDFPLDHGLLSYRICFVSPKSKDKVNQVSNLDELRKFTIAQGTNWPDLVILKNNHFQVVEVPVYTSLFKMVASNRIDLVCRGINELRQEYHAFKHYGNLLYDESFVLIYKMPYKLYFNQSSAELVKQIESGLSKAEKDGSLEKLFQEHYRLDLEFAQLKKRKRFYLNSGYEDSFSDTYKSYLYDPFK